MKYKYNKELQKLSEQYPLNNSERENLKSLLISKGQLMPILLWNGYIVDGHNRLSIMKEIGMEPYFKEVEFDSLDDAKLFIIDNYIGQRNLTDGQKYEAGLVKKELLLKKGRENQSHGKTAPGKTLLSTVDKSVKHNTQKELASELGWSTGKVAMADKVWKEAKPQVKEKIKKGETSINQAYKEIKKEEKRKRYQEKKQEFDKEIDQTVADSYCFNGSCLDYIKDFDKEIDLVLTDPPYAMDFKSGWNDWDKIEGDKRNDTIQLLDNCFGLLKEKMKDDAHIYVFGNPNEIESIRPLFEKYFVLKNILIWDRKVIGMGDLKTYGRSYDIVYFGYNKVWKNLNGTRDRDILDFKRVNPGELIHPTEKPLNLLKYLIKKSSNESDVVIDPFAGSCSTIRAGFELNRNSYGSELEKKYIPEWMLTKI